MILDDLFGRTRAAFQQGQGDFVKTELAACSRYALLAASLYSGGRTSFADQQVAMAEDSYETAKRLVADPGHARRLTMKTVSGLTRKLQALRERLDGLQRFKQ